MDGIPDFPPNSMEMNDRDLSLLRVLDPDILADPFAHYRSLRSYDRCIGIPICTPG
jgi:hypothetical protein